MKLTGKLKGNEMQLTGELKEKVENAKSAEEAKKILKDAGVELTDTELDQVAGGGGYIHVGLCLALYRPHVGECRCDRAVASRA